MGGCGKGSGRAGGGGLCGLGGSCETAALECDDGSRGGVVVGQALLLCRVLSNAATSV